MNSSTSGINQSPPLQWARLGGLYFVALFIPASWTLALSAILKSSGYEEYTGWAFAVPPIAGIISPLLFGAYAEQKVEAQKLLQGIALISSIFLALAFEALNRDWGIEYFFLFFSLNALFAAPISPLVASICLHHTPNTEKDFPMIRLWGTFGWMFAGLLISWGMQWDDDPRVGWLATAGRLLLALLCFFVPSTPPKTQTQLSWKDRLGWNGLQLLKVRDYRVFFLSLLLMSIPTATLYMSTPLLLGELGVEQASGYMTMAQVLEVFAMFIVGWLLSRYRIKWVMMTAIAIGFIRFISYALGAHLESLFLVSVGIVLHGLNYTLFFVTSQVFLQKRVPVAVKIQAQALYAVMTTGLGNALGSIIMNDIFQGAQHWFPESYWTYFWGFCALWVLALGLYFLFGYQGKGGKNQPTEAN